MTPADYLAAIGGAGGLVALLTVVVRWQSGLTGRASAELTQLVGSLRTEVGELRTQLTATQAQLVATQARESALRVELSRHAEQLAEARERIVALERENREARDALVAELLEAERRRRGLTD